MPDLVKAKIRDVVDFPKQGIIYKDITTAIKHPETFRRIIDFLTDKFKDSGIDYVAAIESRGFIFGAPLAYNLNAGLVIIRKPGKLPASVEQASYDLEYGSDTIEIHKDAIEPGKKVLIIDDLLATGGTSSAAYQLVTKLEGVTIAMAYVIELSFLNGRNNLPKDVEIVSMIEF